MVLTIPGPSSIVDSHKSIIYTVDQVRAGEKGQWDDHGDRAQRGPLQRTQASVWKNYVWCPRCVLVECDCEQRLVLTPFNGECKCGRDHTTLVREELAARGSEEGIYIPWRDEYRNWLEGEQRHSEHDHWLEWRSIE